MTDTYDDMANNAVTTGAVFIALADAFEHRPGFAVTIPEAGPPNQLEIRLDFMASPYRVTIERIDEDD